MRAVVGVVGSRRAGGRGGELLASSVWKWKWMRACGLRVVVVVMVAVAVVVLVAVVLVVMDGRRGDTW